jgi:hypothetical protein
MHRKRTAYYRKVEHEVLNRGRTRGDQYDRWIEEWTISATRVLDGVLTYYKLLRNERQKVGLPATVFEPSQGSYRSIQAFYAAVAPAESAIMKQKFVVANLSAVGFDHPYKPDPAPPKKPMPARLTALFIILVLIVAFVVASHFVKAPVLAGIGTVVLLLYIVIEIVALRRENKLGEKGFVDIIKLIIEKRLKIDFGTNKKGDS